MDHENNYANATQDKSMNPHPCNTVSSRIVKFIKTEK